VHPDTARRAGLIDGAPARVVSRRGRARALVRCVPGMRLDTVFLPFHFGAEQAANLVTNPVLDPVSRMPEFKACAVRLEPAQEEAPPVPFALAACTSHTGWAVCAGYPRSVRGTRGLITAAGAGG